MASKKKVTKKATKNAKRKPTKKVQAKKAPPKRKPAPSKKKPTTKAKKARPVSKPKARPKQRVAKSSELLDNALESLLSAKGTRGVKGQVLKAQREKWFDIMYSRAPVKGRKRTKIRPAPTADKARRPEPKQFYTEARAFSSGKAFLQYLQNRPFIMHLLGYEGFTFGDKQKKRKPSQKDMREIRKLEFLANMPRKEKTAMVKHIAEVFEAANMGGVMVSAEIDYERPSKTPVKSEPDDFDNIDWEKVDKKARKTRKQSRKN